MQDDFCGNNSLEQGCYEEITRGDYVIKCKYSINPKLKLTEYDAVVLVYDMSNKVGFKEALYNFRHICKDLETSIMTIVGTKSDKCVSRNYCQKFRYLADKRGMNYIEVSSNEDENIDEIFGTIVNKILQHEYIYQKYFKFFGTDLQVIDLSREVVESIDSYEFSGRNFKTISFPMSLRSLGSNSFKRCLNLTSIDFSNTILEKIGMSPFLGSGIRKIKLPLSVKVIPTSCLKAFQAGFSIDLGNTKIERIFYDEALPPDISTIFFPKSLKKIGIKCFKGCKSLNLIDLSQTSIEEIGINSFSDSGVQTIILGRNIRKIPSSCLKYYNKKSTIDLTGTKIEEIRGDDSGSSSITDILFPFTLNFIGSKSFVGWKNLTMINLSATTVEEIGWSAFSDSGIETILLPATLKKIGPECFSGCKNLTDIDFIVTHIVELGYNAFKDSGIQSITLPQTLVKIGSRCFQGCKDLQTADLTLTHVEEIQWCAFNNSGLLSIKVSKTLKVIGPNCFEGCRTLLYVDLTDTIVEEIDQFVFKDSGTQTIKLPKSLKKLRENCFNGATDLQYLHFDHGTVIEEIQDNTFLNTKISTIVFPRTFTAFNAKPFSQGSIKSLIFPTNEIIHIKSATNAKFTCFCQNGTGIDGDTHNISINNTLWVPHVESKNDIFVNYLQEYDDFTFVENIYRDGANEVNLMKDKDGNSVACKILLERGEEGDKNFLREIETHIRLCHPTILPLIGFGYIKKQNKNCIFTQFRKQGTLSNVIFGKSSSWWTNTKKMICIIDLLLALNYAHVNGVIHRDVKPSNIFICEDHFELGDFGIAKLYSPDETRTVSTTYAIGTRGYQAPEVLIDAEYSEASDVYAFGIVLHEIITGKDINIPDITDMKFNQLIINGKHPSLPKKINKNAKGIIQMCLSAKPKNRPSCFAILRYLHQIKFDILDNIDEDLVMGHFILQAHNDEIFREDCMRDTDMKCSVY